MTIDNEEQTGPLNKTDEAILDVMSDGRRYTAGLLAELIDADRAYVNARLALLAKLDYLDRVHKGLYVRQDSTNN
ncbi:hypothetical protein SAMN06264855_1178 [Halorubrum vacuolatum]|uniref:Uncharacterized protein n=1 Tax=Halorubrum vacuolatum TaxID=63740 RepID=A0A238XF62_HALVU|nr:hypothetical protein SAMN06264855_1178 [Halorubrum vacuolatum]